MDIRTIKRKINEYGVRLTITILINKFFVGTQIIKPNAYFYHRLVFPFFKFIMTINSNFKSVIIALAWEDLYSNQKTIPDLQRKKWENVEPTYGFKENAFIGHYRELFAIAKENIDDLIANRQLNSIVEIGCIHGKGINMIANQYKEINFLGVDFNVSYANQNHKLDNLGFYQGYFEDFFNKNEDSGINLIFGIRVFELMTPRELEYFIELCIKNRVQYILHVDSLLYLLKTSTKPNAHSRAYYKGFWFHNYPAYFMKSGFKIIKSESKKLKKYKHSHRGEYNAYIGVYELQPER